MVRRKIISMVLGPELPTQEEFEHRLTDTIKRASEAVGRRNYRLGATDGVLMTVAMILGDDPESAAGEPYRGELPDELHQYLQAVRRKVVEVQQEDDERWGRNER